jgi:hypothetical protein
LISYTLQELQFYQIFVLKHVITAARAEGGGGKIPQGDDTDCSTGQREVVTHLPS